jgi:hypothetical protein
MIFFDARQVSELHTLKHWNQDSPAQYEFLIEFLISDMHLTLMGFFQAPELHTAVLLLCKELTWHFLPYEFGQSCMPH